MKLNKHVSSDRSKSRKRHFSAPSHIRCVPPGIYFGDTKTIVSADAAWCPLPSPRSSEPSMELGPCLWGKMTRFRYVLSFVLLHLQISYLIVTNFRLQEDTTRASRWARSSSATERSSKQQNSEAAGIIFQWFKFSFMENTWLTSQTPKRNWSIQRIFRFML